MIRVVLGTFERAEDVVRLIVRTALTVLFGAVTVRFALAGGGFELIFLAGVTVGLVFLTRRIYRRVRARGREGALIK